jgi:hypothetical protein
VVEVGTGAGTPESGDTELARMLVAGNGGRFVLVSRGERGSLASIYVPAVPAGGAAIADGVPGATTAG